MNAATYVEKIPTVTACQWDGTAEARDWIVAGYNGMARAQDEDIIVEGAVHNYTLARDVWIVRIGDGDPVEFSDEQFRATYEVKAG